MKSKNNYNCSKHGNIGNPDCEECKENLRRLCLDNNAHLIEPEEFVKNTLGEEK